MNCIELLMIRSFHTVRGSIEQLIGCLIGYFGVGADRDEMVEDLQ